MKEDIDAKLERLRSVVEALPEGDEDREDLLLLFAELERVKTTNARLKGRLRGARKLRREHRQLSGALNLCRYALKTTLLTVSEKDVTIGWLRRRVSRRGDLSDYEKQELKTLTLEDRLNDRSIQGEDG